MLCARTGRTAVLPSVVPGARRRPERYSDRDGCNPRGNLPRKKYEMHSRTSALRSSAAISMSVAALIFAFAACGGGSGNGYGNAPTAAATSSGGTTPAAAKVTVIAPTLILTSDGFTNGGAIPAKYSCAGDAMSPALAWSGAPAGTKSFALIVHDPDAPLADGFTHWLVVDLPGATTSLPPAIFQDAAVPGGGTQLIGYSGMCPPVGAVAHHYHFRLYALDTTLGVAASASKDTVEAAMKGHILAETDLVGLFARPNGP